MRKYRGQKIFKTLTLARVIPSLATLSALLVGMTQVRFAIGEQWEFAALFVVAAAFFDLMDGRLARLLNSCSRFGAELDSLSDFAVFGICPAIVLYLFSLSELNELGWVISTFFAVSVCLRLARFNTHDIENIKSPLSGLFFTGVPAPAGAILAIFPIVLYNAFKLEIFRNQYVSAAAIIAASILCVSKIPTLSIKKFHVKKENYTIFLLSSIVVIGAIFAYTWKMFVFIILSYIASIFITSSRAKRILKNDKTSADK
jgi:CDP-diacylglycerol--serine O-phosphatidyltransferase